MPANCPRFVPILFAVLGLAFAAETLTLAWEFRSTRWFEIAAADSHNFLFWPTLGLLALAAFLVPAAAIADLYWNHLTFGRVRLLIGLSATLAMSWLIGSALDASPFRSIWELSPAIAAADTREPAGCGSDANPCRRIGYMEALGNIRSVSHSRLGLRDFVRLCEADSLIEPVSTPEPRRFCFAASPLTQTPRLSTGEECCRAQAAMQQAINTAYADPGKRSTTGAVHPAALLVKVFFLHLLALISILLAVHHRKLEQLYPDAMLRIDTGVVIGAAAMIFFPLMSQAFVETADALYGTAQNQGFKPIVPFLSFAFGAWALLLLMFFYRRHDREVELAGKVSGVLASAVAIVKYDLIIALVNRFFGSGAGWAPAVVLMLLTLAGCYILFVQLGRRRGGNDGP